MFLLILHPCPSILCSITILIALCFSKFEIYVTTLIYYMITGIFIIIPLISLFRVGDSVFFFWSVIMLVSRVSRAGILMLRGLSRGMITFFLVCPISLQDNKPSFCIALSLFIYIYIWHQWVLFQFQMTSVFIKTHFVFMFFEFFACFVFL